MSTITSTEQMLADVPGSCALISEMKIFLRNIPGVSILLNFCHNPLVNDIILQDIYLYFQWKNKSTELATDLTILVSVFCVFVLQNDEIIIWNFLYPSFYFIPVRHPVSYCCHAVRNVESAVLLSVQRCFCASVCGGHDLQLRV